MILLFFHFLSPSFSLSHGRTGFSANPTVFSVGRQKTQNFHGMIIADGTSLRIHPMLFLFGSISVDTSDFSGGNKKKNFLYYIQNRSICKGRMKDERDVNF